MKNRLFLLVVVLLTTLSTRAVDVIEPNTDYYILNVETDMFLGAQNYWGTQGAVSTDAGIFQFVPGTTGSGYNIKNTLVAVTNKNLGTNLYTDNAGTMPVKDDEEAGTTKTVDGIWTIENMGGGIFAFFCPSQWAYTNEEWVETKHGYLAKSNVNGYRKGYELTFSEELTDACLFRVMTYQEALDYMVNKAQTYNVSYNFLIKNPDFCRNQSTDDWTVSSNCTNYTLGTTRGNTGNNTFNNNTCAESYRSPFAIYQVVKNLPAGRYQLSAQGFYRHDAGSDTDYPYVYVGPSANPIAKSILPKHDGSENSMYTSGESFANGKYKADNVRFELKEETDLEVGFYAANGNYWVIFDNIQLMSYSNVPEYAQELLAEIKYPIEGVGSADTKDAYDNAYSTFKNWVEALQPGDASFDDVDTKYAVFTEAENAWKASIETWKTYTVAAEKAKKLYTQIASQEGKYNPSVAMNALNAYINGAASAYGPGSTSGTYTFQNGCYNYIMQTLSMNDVAIVEESIFLDGLMGDVKKTVVKPGMDVSFLLNNYDFTDPNGGGWKNTHTMGNWTLYGGLSGWPVAEAFANKDGDTFNLWQTVEKAPAGLYSISINAFFRPAGTWNAETPVLVELYMGSISNKIQNLAADPITYDLEWNEDEKKWLGTIAKNGTNCYFWNGDFAGMTDADREKIWTYNENEDEDIRTRIQNSTDLTVNGKYGADAIYENEYLIPNSMEGASIAFSAGRYPMKVYGEVTDDGDGTGTLTIGLRSTQAMPYGSWCLWGAFKLELLGEDRNAMRLQLIEKLSALQDNPLLIEGSGLQEVFLNDTIAKRIPEYQALINNDLATYQDYKDAYDDVSYLISKLDVYKEAIDNFTTAQGELQELITAFDGDEKYKRFAQNVYDVFGLMSGLETGSMISLTDEDMENLLIYDEATYGAAPTILNRILLENPEFNPSLAADGAYTSTYDAYYEFMKTIRMELGSIYIQVAGTGRVDTPEDVTSQLRNPNFDTDEQWAGSSWYNWGNVGIRTEDSDAEQYGNTFDTYQPLWLPAGYYTFVSWGMDRRDNTKDAITGDDSYAIDYATYMYANIGRGTESVDTIAGVTCNSKYVALTTDLLQGTYRHDIFIENINGVTWYMPQNMDTFADWMAAKTGFGYDGLGGKYIQFQVPEGGAYTSIGFFRRQNAGTSWFICDGIQLFYATDGLPEPTGVSTLSTSTEKFGKADGKYLENNRLVIYSNGKKFNTAGQIVK
jgi:hypothetical protein